MLTRRDFVVRTGAALVAAQAAGLIDVIPAARAQAGPGDTLQALLAFVVPGTDSFSISQGLTHPTPGGVDAGVLPALVETLDAIPTVQPPFPTSVVAAGLLDQVAAAVDPQSTSFADLTYPDKIAVFAFLEADPTLAPLATALIALSGFMAYSEAGVFDANTRTLTGRPLGWELTGYPGESDGRDELVGYYRNRKKATS